ncbi:extracellular solute-binding protein [Lactiplantibacillus sp. WILCCON 0030]|uniref:Maltodextrin-binding protein n=1 Tax=Lactiplantibacillus brownii TaxID=3069269 RepID=A0ABU1A5B2_9LACO|nr:extracellular solute-binding protein [Lactiplantibacillus brownii]MDQ7936179.1 extracellular solute-binding protein [Lactiplantibacillus brownii]
MSTWKKLGMGVLATGLALTLVGCGNSKSSSSSSSKMDKTLKVSADPSYKSYMKSVIPKFEKKYNVKVKVSYKAMLDEDDALKLDGPSGKGPDVLMAPYDRVGQMASQGQLTTAKLTSGRYNATGKKSVTYKGKVYAAPVTIESDVLYYNKKLLKNAPKNFTELEKLAKDSKYAYANDKTKNVAFLTQWTNFYNSFGVIKGYGGYVFGDNNTNYKKIGLNNAGAVDGLTYMTKWFTKYWPSGMQNVTSNENFVTQQFTTGKTAAVIDGPWMAATYKKSKVDYGVAVLPTLTNGKDYQAFAGGKAWAISNYSKHKTAAQAWLDYISNNANQKTFYKKTGEIPANTVARKSASDSGDAMAAAVSKQYDKDVPLINLPQMAEVWTPAQTMMTNAAAGKMTPKQAANKATKTIKTNISQKYDK